VATNPGPLWWKEPFLGWRHGWHPRHPWLVARGEDHCGTIGPPRVGKTAGLLVPQLLTWDGPVIAASTKPDLLLTAGDRRDELAGCYGGRVYLHMHSVPDHLARAEGNGPDSIYGVRPLHWDLLAGCEEPAVAVERARALIWSAGAGSGVKDALHWLQGAAAILQGYLHAAALAPEADLLMVKRWLARQELEIPAHEIERSTSSAREYFPQLLRGMANMPPDERGSMFSPIRQALAGTDLPDVLERSRHSDLDVDEFLRTRSTMFIVSPSRRQEMLAPLIATLIEAVVERVYSLWHTGDLPRRLLLVLDELANIAPLPSLLSILSEGASQGVVLTWAVQSLYQLRAKYGDSEAQTIFSSTRAKVLFGGSSDEHDLSSIEKLLGEVEVPTRSTSRDRQGNWSRQDGWQRLPRISASQMRAIPAGQALVLYGTYDPELVDSKIAARTKPFAGLTGWRGAIADPGSG
jgi:type IV secretion system protein VirD4